MTNWREKARLWSWALRSFWADLRAWWKWRPRFRWRLTPDIAWVGVISPFLCWREGDTYRRVGVVTEETAEGIVPLKQLLDECPSCGIMAVHVNPLSLYVAPEDKCYKCGRGIYKEATTNGKRTQA